MYTIATLTQACKLNALLQAYIEISAHNSASDQIIDRALHRSGYDVTMKESSARIVTAELRIEENKEPDIKVTITFFDDNSEKFAPGALYFKVQDDMVLYGEY